MPDTLPSPSITASEQLDAYHSQIVTSTEPDYRYFEPLSNAQKVGLICSILRTQPETFDLSANYPLKDWSNSADLALLRCGLYIADLRASFFSLIVNNDEKNAKHAMWEAQAESQFWMDEFDQIIYRRQTGEKRPMRHTLQ